MQMSRINQYLTCATFVCKQSHVSPIQLKLFVRAIVVDCGPLFAFFFLFFYIQYESSATVKLSHASIDSYEMYVYVMEGEMKKK